MNLGQIIKVPKKIGDFSISIWIKVVYELSFKLITYDSLVYLLLVYGDQTPSQASKSSEHVLVVNNIFKVEKISNQFFILLTASYKKLLKDYSNRVLKKLLDTLRLQ